MHLHVLISHEPEWKFLEYSLWIVKTSTGGEDTSPVAETVSGVIPELIIRFACAVVDKPARADSKLDISKEAMVYRSWWKKVDRI